MPVKYKGINYDTGTRTITGGLTREYFDPLVTAREIHIIKNELHCNAIRITGIFIERITKASEIALHAGLAVFFSPFLPYENQENTLQFMVDGATAAEALRQNFPEIVYVTGLELSLFTPGFIDGHSGDARMKKLFSPLSMIKNMAGVPRSYNRKLNKFLAKAVAAVRSRFHGRITYASGSWEKIDWTFFDIMGVDHYRSTYNKTTYVRETSNFKKMSKPVCIMEFGCCAYKGADDKGAMGWAIVDWKKERPELKETFTRNEKVQAGYLSELLAIFNNEQLEGAFIFTFITPNYIHRDDPKYDLDMASYGIVKALENGRTGYKDLPWQPKLAFFEIAKNYE